jgi:hypothetical protein
VGAGFIREGSFIHGARWLQPYLEFSFVADTKSGVEEGQISILEENLVSLFGGMRAQVLSNTDFFVYAKGGGTKELIDFQHEGNWFEDFQGGFYGHESIGPGTIMLDIIPNQIEAGDLDILQGSQNQSLSSDRFSLDPIWRCDWFVEGGGDFSYYNRLSNGIIYAESLQGLRLLQLGTVGAVDAYAVENFSLDTRGSFFDNLGEIGPGIRMLWSLCDACDVMLTTEYLNGFYFGRNEHGNRNEEDGQYDDVRVKFSMTTRW